jgi:hypothetical protein
MNLDRSEVGGTSQIPPESRKVWAQPSFSRLRAGSAENMPGSRIVDGSIEGLGS